MTHNLKSILLMAFATKATLLFAHGQHEPRIQGPTVLIEHQALGGNHIHSLWRDPEQDFGKDLLLEHLEKDHANH